MHSDAAKELSRGAHYTDFHISSAMLCQRLYT